MEFSKEYIEKQNRILNELHSHNLADRMKTMPISDNTRAALYFKGKVQDTIDTLFSLHELMYSITDDDTSEEFVKAGRALHEIADKYIIDCINENIGIKQNEI